MWFTMANTSAINVQRPIIRMKAEIVTLHLKVANTKLPALMRAICIRSSTKPATRSIKTGWLEAQLLLCQELLPCTQRGIVMRASHFHTLTLQIVWAFAMHD